MAVLGFFSFPAFSRAGNPPTEEGKSLASILSYGIPTDPLHQGTWVLKVSPGYVVNQDNTDQSTMVDMKGWGGAAAATYAFTDHLGLAFIAGGNHISGSRGLDSGGSSGPIALFPGVNPGGPLNGQSTGSGFLGAVSVIWDHWSGDGFRLPVFAGLSYLDLTETVDDTTAGVKRVGVNHTPGAYLGLVPQFNILKVRVAPFLTYSMGFQNVNTTLTSYDPATGATFKQMSFVDTHLNEESRNVHTAGVSFSYIPWGMGFTYIPSQINPGISAYTLTWSKRFGEAAISAKRP